MKKQTPLFTEIMRDFAPGWFAVVMGTGILAIVTCNLGQYWPLLTPLGESLHWMNTVIFLLLAPMWIGRWLRFREDAVKTLMHPTQADFYPTFSIGMLVLAGQWRLFSPEYVGVALALWWLGAMLTFVFSFAVLFFMFEGDHVTLDHITPAKFIPAVGLVVIPLSGSSLLQEMSGVARDFALTVNVIGLGSGGMMYVALLGLTVYRTYLHKPVQGMLAPTAWIHLAPIGVIPVSLLNLLDQLPYTAAREMTLVVMLLIWGFGVWWLIMSILLTIAVLRVGQLPFTLSWWGFTFPLGAFVAEGLRLNQETGGSGFLGISVISWILLWALWLITVIKTGCGIWTGRIFQPYP